MPVTPPPRASRRRVLAVSAAVSAPLVLGATGCDLAVPSRESSGNGATPSQTPSPTTAGPEDPDAELVARVADDVAGTLAVVTAAGRGRPTLRRSLRDVARTHRAHLEELAASPRSTGRVRVGGDDRAAVRRVRVAEQQLQRRLTEAAVEAQSGPLAALLASMAAAVAQRLASGVLA